MNRMMPCQAALWLLQGAPPTAAYSQPPQLPLPRGPNIPGGWPAASGLDRVPDHPSCCDAAAWAGVIDGAGPSVGWCTCVPGVAVPSRGSLADSLRLFDPVSSMACPEGEAAKGCTGAGGAQGQQVTDQQACEPGLLGSCSCTRTCMAQATPWYSTGSCSCTRTCRALAGT